MFCGSIMADISVPTCCFSLLDLCTCSWQIYWFKPHALKPTSLITLIRDQIPSMVSGWLNSSWSSKANYGFTKYRFAWKWVSHTSHGLYNRHFTGIPCSDTSPAFASNKSQLFLAKNITLYIHKRKFIHVESPFKIRPSSYFFLRTYPHDKSFFTSHMKSLYEITTLDFIKQHMVFTSQEPLFLPGQNTYVRYIWVVLLTNHHSRARSNLWCSAAKGLESQGGQRQAAKATTGAWRYKWYDFPGENGGFNGKTIGKP